MKYVFALLLLCAAFEPAAAQLEAVPSPRESTEKDPTKLEEVQVDDSAMVRRQVEMLVRSGQLDQAIELLESRREDKGLEETLARRLARLYRDAGRNQDLERYLVDRIGDDLEKADIGQLRMLADARFELGNEAGAREALDALLARDPEDASLVRLVSNVYMQNGRNAEALRVLEKGRDRLGQDADFAQLMGRLYASEGRLVDATREYAQVIVDSPLNVSLMRGQILDLAQRDPAQLPGMLGEVEKLVEANPSIGQLALVSAELRLRLGDGDGAWERVEPLLADPDLLQEMLRMALAGLADSRLPGADPAMTLERLRLSARITRGLLGNAELPSALEPRVYDTLTRTLLAMLENETFTNLPEADQLHVLEEARVAILDMNDRFAGNNLTAAAMLRLAGIYVDALHRPQDAIALYRGLTLSPNAPREQVQVARVGLGRSYIAAGDTAQARTIFYEIGQDMDFVEGQGRAQFHLGMIDFMGGSFTTAADRFKAVALEAPRAEYTNDALDLALILAEAEFEGAGESESLRRYGRALYHRATHQPDSLLADLETIGREGEGLLQERARLDLARLHESNGEFDAALVLLDRIVTDAPECRYAPGALDLKGQVLEKQGRTEEAIVAYEKVLLDHEEYILMDRVRDRIRVLRGGSPDDEGELP